MCATPQCGATVRYVDPSGQSPQPVYGEIAMAIQNSFPGDTVIVVPGTYRELNPLLIDKNVTVRSEDPSDRAVVASSVIDGQAAGPAVTFGGNEGETCVLEGFTITNGRATDGGGINGNGTLATIRNNVITGNVALGAFEFDYATVIAYTGGGGIYWCNGLIENNIISDNQAGGVEIAGVPSVGSGGGLFRCHGIIRNNTIVRNKALGQAVVCTQPPFGCLPVDSAGGGLCFCNGTIQANYIAYNDGSGLDSCHGIVAGNTVAHNSGLGITGDARIASNIIYGNARGGISAGGETENNLVWGNYGTGIRASGWGAVRHNTAVENLGGGLELSPSTSSRTPVVGCVVWGNTGGPQVCLYDGHATYSCIQDWTGGGEGNISEDPGFVDAENGDFRLMPDSPCIDAGFNDPGLPDTDIAGMHRIMFGGKSLTVDMGAYEFYINDLTPGPNPDQTTFTWSSLADKTYSIFYSPDLLTWHLAIASFPSSGNQTTSWTDDGSLTGLPPSLSRTRFYRLLENP